MGRGRGGGSYHGNPYQQAMAAANRQEARDAQRERQDAARRQAPREPYTSTMKEDNTTHSIFGDGHEPHGHAVVDESGEIEYLRDETGAEY